MMYQRMKTSDPYWRWCSKCEVLSYWDGERSPGKCPVNGVHDHRGSSYYIPARFEADATYILSGDLQPGQNFTSPSNKIRIDVLSFADSEALIRIIVS